MKISKRNNARTSLYSLTLVLLGAMLFTPMANGQNVSGLWCTSDGAKLMLSGDLETGVMGVLTGSNYTVNDLLPITFFGFGAEDSLHMESLTGQVVLSVGFTGDNSTFDSVEGVLINEFTNEELEFTATRDNFIGGSELDGFWVIEEESGNQSLLFAYTIEFFSRRTFLLQFEFDGSFYIYDGVINDENEYRGQAMFYYYQRGIRFNFNTHGLDGRLYDVGDIPELGLDFGRDISGHRLF